MNTQPKMEEREIKFDGSKRIERQHTAKNLGGKKKKNLKINTVHPMPSKPTIADQAHNLLTIQAKLDRLPTVWIKASDTEILEEGTAIWDTKEREGEVVEFLMQSKLSMPAGPGYSVQFNDSEEPEKMYMKFLKIKQVSEKMTLKGVKDGERVDVKAVGAGNNPNIEVVLEETGEELTVKLRNLKVPEEQALDAILSPRKLSMSLMSPMAGARRTSVSKATTAKAKATPKEEGGGNEQRRRVLPSDMNEDLLNAVRRGSKEIVIVQRLPMNPHDEAFEIGQETLKSGKTALSAGQRVGDFISVQEDVGMSAAISIVATSVARATAEQVKAARVFHRDKKEDTRFELSSRHVTDERRVVYKRALQFIQSYGQPTARRRSDGFMARTTQMGVDESSSYNFIDPQLAAACTYAALIGVQGSKRWMVQEGEALQGAGLAASCSAKLNGLKKAEITRAVQKAVMWLGGDEDDAVAISNEIEERRKQAQKHFRKMRQGILLMGAVSAFAGKQKKVAKVTKRNGKVVPIAQLKTNQMILLLNSGEEQRKQHVEVYVQSGYAEPESFLQKYKKQIYAFTAVFTVAFLTVMHLLWLHYKVIEKPLYIQIMIGVLGPLIAAILGSELYEFALEMMAESGAV